MEEIIIMFLLIGTSMSALTTESEICVDDPSSVDYQTCFELITSSKNFTHAAEYCTATGGHLVDSQGDATNEALRGLVDSNLVAQVWLGVQEEDYDWEAIFGKGSFTRWGRGKPKEQSEYNGCVLMDAQYGLDWMPGACNEKHAFICSFDAECSTGGTLPTEKDGCLSFNFDPMTWFEARSECVRQGGDLAAVTSQKTMSELKFKLEGYGKSYWTRFNDKKWILSSGLELPYFKWADGYPKHGDATCVVILSDGYWTDEDCATELPFICEKRYKILEEELELPDQTGSKPEVQKPPVEKPPKETSASKDDVSGHGEPSGGQLGARTQEHKVSAVGQYSNKLIIGLSVGAAALIIMIATIALFGYRRKQSRKKLLKQDQRIPSHVTVARSESDGSINSLPSNMDTARRYYPTKDAPNWQGPDKPQGGTWDWKTSS